MTRRELEILAAGAAVGALRPSEVEQFEAAVANDPELRGDAAALSDAVAAFAAALIPATTPPAELRAKVLASIAGVEQRKLDAAEGEAPVGFRFIRREEGDWIETGAPGFRVKMLSGNPDFGPQVMFAELVPGGKVPEHDHIGSEDLYVLSGHLQTEGRTLGPGDYLHAEPGTHHQQLISPDGCTALLVLGAAQTY